MTDDEHTPGRLTPALREKLATMATATLTYQLQMRGIRNTFLSGLRPLHPELRMIGQARTLRYVALREDVQQQYAAGINAQKRAVEMAEPGDVLIIEARGVTDAATIGDILATRAFVRAVAGIVTDGALRDTPAIAAIGKPVYHLASHGATLGRMHMPFQSMSRSRALACL